jgi:hypothetical protein
VERSITQATTPDGAANLNDRDPNPSAEYAGLGARRGKHPIFWGIALVLLCLVVYGASQPNRGNVYLHFVLQAQAWLDGETSIQTPGYQDVMPLGTTPDGTSCVATGDNSDCTPNGQGIIPFPPMPAIVLLPFVALWHAATNQQLLASMFAAVDVGIAYWMLGYLPIHPRLRGLTALFLAFGTVLWYAAAIGSTWFFAHVVAVAALLLSVGLALSADRDATEPRPLREATSAFTHLRWPGGWPSFVLTLAAAALTGLLFHLAGSGSTPMTLVAVGVALGLVGTALAVAVARRPGVLGPFLVALAVVGGLPALIIGGSQSMLSLAVAEGCLVAIGIALLWLLRPHGARQKRLADSLLASASSVEARQVAAGILFGLAVSARLTIIFGFPFFILVGGGSSWLRRGMLAGCGAAVVVVALLVYTYAATGQLFNPAYQYQYAVETGYGVFAYNPDWSITDVRYIPQNLMIMLFQTPKVLPTIRSIYPDNVAGAALCTVGQARGLFNPNCPLMMPDAIGTSILLTSPAFLLAPLAWRPLRHLRVDRVTVGATIAVLAIATVNLMHFSQGWVQFGYRFSNDFVPFALLLVALGASRLNRLWPVVLLIAVSIVVNFWGTTWGVALGW